MEGLLAFLKPHEDTVVAEMLVRAGKVTYDILPHESSHAFALVELLEILKNQSPVSVHMDPNTE